MQASAICLLASRIAKGGTGMVALAGQMLTLVLEDLKLNRDLKVNRVTQPVTVSGGTNGPFTLPSDYLRTYDMFYPLQGPNGMTQFLTPITMEQYDAEFKDTQAANYPYEFATDLSSQAQAATATAAGPIGVTAVNVITPGVGYTNVPTLVFAPAGAAAVPRLGLVNFTFAVGLNYAVGDVIFGNNGVFDRPVELVVQAIGGGGGVSSIRIVDPGAYSVIPGAASDTISTGAGTGFKITPVDWILVSAVVSVPGVYAAVPTVQATLGGALTQATLTATIGPVTPAVDGKGQFYIYPQSSGSITLTHRYMRDQPDIVSPETSSQVPWFPFNDYLVKATAARLMGVTGDDRESQFLAECETMLRPYVVMEGDEQQTVRSVRLDPRHFKSNRGLRPTKQNPY